MLKYLLLFFTSFCASLALTPAVRLLALGIGAVDKPGERKIHSEPMPRFGGVSVVLSAVLAFGIAAALGGLGDLFLPVDFAAWLPVLLGGAIVFLGGVWDDIRPLSAGTKVLFQTAAALTAIGLGVRIEQLYFFGTGTWELGGLAIPVTFLWIVGITNAFNLVDGLDGLAVGLASIAAGTCAAIFLLRGDAQNAMLLVILMGALLGFLHYNFNPARIFLGDSGSLTIGYVLGVAAISSSQKGATALAVVVPLLVFGLPIMDTLLAMGRRFVGGLKMLQPYKAPLKHSILAVKRMFQADQAHIHHRLLAIGFSHRNAVLVLYAVALGLSCMALLSVMAQYRNAGIILISIGLATYIGIRKLGYEEISFLRTGTLLRWYEQLAFNRLFFLGFLDMVLIAMAFWGSFILKYEWHWTSEMKEWYLSTFPLVLVIQLVVFTLFGLYRGVWRAASIADLIPVVFAVSSGAALSYAVVQVSIPPQGTLAFFWIDLLLLGSLMAGSRNVYRILDHIWHREREARAGALIYGAGRGGQLVLRELLQNSNIGLWPLGFLDDAPSLQDRSVNRVPVLGDSQDLTAILQTYPVASLIVSSDKIQKERLGHVLTVCKQCRVSVFQGRLRLEAVPETSVASIETGLREPLPFSPLMQSMPSMSIDKR